MSTNKYGLAAVEAVKLCTAQPGLSPIDAWGFAVARHFPNSQTSRAKCCPRDAFLGLCEDGLIQGIKRGSYTRSVRNKRYALEAVVALKKDPTLSKKALWDRIHRDEMKQHNSQMDVVLGLWEANLLCDMSR